MGQNEVHGGTFSGFLNGRTCYGREPKLKPDNETAEAPPPGLQTAA